MKLNAICVYLAVFMICYLSSCIPARKAMYFPDIEKDARPIDSLAREEAQQLYSGDYVMIQVLTMDPEANAIFNSVAGSGGGGRAGGSAYRVDEDGFIEMPLLGRLFVKGLIPIEVREQVRKYVAEYYKDPVVYCTITGKVTILEKGVSGGSGSGEILINDGRLTILEALAGTSAANMKLDRAWIIREIEGKRVTAVVNLNSKEIFNSPYYYLRNNDLIYIEPLPMTRFVEANSPTRNLVGFIAGFAGLIVALFAIAK